MTTETTRAKSKLATLSSSLDELEAHLEPLFAQTLPETALGLETIQQAKLQTVLPYVVYDLIFIYLKSRGIDPKTHPVVAELDRVRQYFEKISNAENPATRRTEIDKEAAGRFIKQAITQAKNTKAPVDDVDVPEASPSTPVPVRVTSKMVQRAQYEEEWKESEMEASEEDALEVFEDEGPRMNMDQESKTQSKGKAKATPPSDGDTAPVGNKRRRAAIDPFAGYGDDFPSSLATSVSAIKGSEPTNFPITPASSDGINLANAEAGAPDSTSSSPRRRSASDENSSHQNSPAPIGKETAKKAGKISKSRKARRSLAT